MVPSEVQKQTGHLAVLRCTPQIPMQRWMLALVPTKQLGLGRDTSFLGSLHNFNHVSFVLQCDNVAEVIDQLTSWRAIHGPLFCLCR